MIGVAIRFVALCFVSVNWIPSTWHGFDFDSNWFVEPALANYTQGRASRSQHNASRGLWRHTLCTSTHKTHIIVYIHIQSVRKHWLPVTAETSASACRPIEICVAPDEQKQLTLTDFLICPCCYYLFIFLSCFSCIYCIFVWKLSKKQHRYKIQFVRNSD